MGLDNSMCSYQAAKLQRSAWSVLEFTSALQDVSCRVRRENQAIVLPILVSCPVLCRDGKCAPPAQSKQARSPGRGARFRAWGLGSLQVRFPSFPQAGRSCDTDLDCETTDETGRMGSCTCKARCAVLASLSEHRSSSQAWWDKDDPKYCMPVAGDYSRHQEALRNYLWFRRGATRSTCIKFRASGARFAGQRIVAISGRSKNACASSATRPGAFLPTCVCNYVNYVTKTLVQAMRLKLAVECETQQLSGGARLRLLIRKLQNQRESANSSVPGPYGPPEECGALVL